MSTCDDDFLVQSVGDYVMFSAPDDDQYANGDPFIVAFHKKHPPRSMTIKEADEDLFTHLKYRRRLIIQTVEDGAKSIAIGNDVTLASILEMFSSDSASKSDLS